MILNESFINELKSRIDLVELVGKYTKLSKVGSDSWQGRCPFPERHTAGDRDPSFIVYANGSFYCYGCGAGAREGSSLGSDCIAFMRMKHDLSFVEAVEELARIADIELPRSTARSERNRQLARVAQHVVKYHTFLKNDDIALSYLHGRGITDSDIDTWELGLVPPQLGYRSISNRVTFPIKNERGIPLGFGYRDIHGDGPKYRNSPDSEIFYKGSLLYGIDRAYKVITEIGKAYITEGYVDVISAHRHGIYNTVGLMGTSFTDGQAKLLRRYTDEIVLALDGDIAGQQRTLAHVSKAREYGFIVKIAQLDAERDLDDHAVILGDKLGEWLETHEVTPADWRINGILGKYRADLHSLRTRCMRETMDILKDIDNALDRAEAIQRITKELELSSLDIL